MAFTALVAACSGDGVGPSKQGAGRRHVVIVRDNYYTPAVLTVQRGDTIEWVNIGSSPHTATSGDPCVADSLWEAPRLESGESLRVVLAGGSLDSTTVVPFHCVDHCVNSNMYGAIYVNR